MTYPNLTEEQSKRAQEFSRAQVEAMFTYIEAERRLTELKEENAKLRDLCEWLLNPYRLGAVTGEGVDKRWCRETYDGGSYRLRELGIEVPK